MHAGEVSGVDRWLNVLIGLGAAFVWAVNALNAAFSADSLSTQIIRLLVCGRHDGMRARRGPGHLQNVCTNARSRELRCHEVP